MSQQSLPATVFRGGTTKGIYFTREHLPADRDQWDELLLKTFGSPDPKQLDGIGGSHSTASKAMIISAPEDDDVDVEYLFAQVGIEKSVVDWGGNCGNLTYAVGPYAMERGLVDPKAEDEEVNLTLRNENTGTVVEQSVPVTDEGDPQYRGDFRVYGVPGTGARIGSRFLDPAGSVTGSLFPTGNRVDTLSVPGVGDIEASLVDVSSPCVFVRASAVGMTAAELPKEIDSDPDLLETLEAIRSQAAARLGFVDDADDATAESPGIPKMAVVGEKQPYRSSIGEEVTPDEYDLLARIMSMQKAHHAYSITGSMCTATAALFSGTIPNEFLANDDTDQVTIGHPKGTLTVGVGREGDDVRYTEAARTARQIMHGDLFYLPSQ
jgi:2-methylaconitate cis-trans-isomerase PrpF